MEIALLRVEDPMRTSLLSLLFLASIIAPHPCDAQDTLRLHHRAFLDAAHLGGSAFEVVVASWGADGFGVAPLIDQGVVGFFSADGNIDHTIGRLGSGPAEFREIGRIIPWGSDSLAVYDAVLQRVTLLDVGGTVARQFPFTLGRRLYQAVPLAADRWALNVPGVADRAVVIADSTWTALRALPRGSDADPFAQFRILAASSNGGFWEGALYQYRLTLSTSAGDTVQSLVVQRSWFPDAAPATAAPNEERPPPMLIGLVEETPMLLRTHVAVARSAWRPGPVPGAQLDAFSFGEYYDTVIELIDTRTGQSQGLVRAPGLIWPVIGGRSVYRLGLSPESEPTLEILEVNHGNN